MSDQPREIEGDLARRRDADDEIVLPGQSMKQQAETGQERREQRGTLAGRELPKPLAEGGR